MAKRRSCQQWQAIFQQYDSSTLTKKAFCQKNNIPLSTFFVKRRQHLTSINIPAQKEHQSPFIRAEVISQRIFHPINDAKTATQSIQNMTLSLRNIELSIPADTSATYLAELINALSL